MAYTDHAVEIPPEAVDQEFVRSLSALVQRLGRDSPARRVPSAGECRFCDITRADCPERMEGEPQAGGDHRTTSSSPSPLRAFT